MEERAISESLKSCAESKERSGSTSLNARTKSKERADRPRDKGGPIWGRGQGSFFYTIGTTCMYTYIPTIAIVRNN